MTEFQEIYQREQVIYIWQILLVETNLHFFAKFV